MCIKGYGSPALSKVEAGALFFEIAKRDFNTCGFLMIHNCLGIEVIDKLGSEELKARILPSSVNLEKIICFGLTEPGKGTDASDLNTYATKVFEYPFRR